MTPEQDELLLQSADSIAAAKVLLGDPMHAGFSASRSYYAMFYAAQAVMLSVNMTFKKHSSVIAAFGKEFAKTGILPLHLHKNLVTAEKRRISGDYDPRNCITPAQAEESVRFAEEFLTAIKSYLLQLP